MAQCGVDFIFLIGEGGITSGFVMAEPDTEYLIMGRGVWIGESWERKG